MNSLFQHISQSSTADHWRRFRMAAEEFSRLLLTARSLGYDIREGEDHLIRVGDRRGLLCVAESSSCSPSPFHILVNPYSVSVTDAEEAAAEFAEWFPLSGPLPAPGDHAPLLAILRSEERASWLTLECAILHAVQSLNQLELEGEPLFLSLGRIIRELLSPELLELELESAADFWPGRAAGWTWLETKTGIESQHITLTPRLQRLIYRRDRVLYIEDFAAAPDIQIGRGGEEHPYRTGFLLPLI
jgi:hypothetical protein